MAKMIKSHYKANRKPLKDIQEKERPRSEIETFLDLAEQPYKT